MAWCDGVLASLTPVQIPANDRSLFRNQYSLGKEESRALGWQERRPVDSQQTLRLASGTILTGKQHTRKNSDRALSGAIAYVCFIATMRRCSRRSVCIDSFPTPMPTPHRARSLLGNPPGPRTVVSAELRCT